jgi:hypothetical protein
LIALVISAAAAWPAEHTASNTRHGGQASLHHFLDQGLHRFPFGVIRDLHLLFNALEPTLLELRGIKVSATSRGWAGIILSKGLDYS